MKPIVALIVIGVIALAVAMALYVLPFCEWLAKAVSRQEENREKAEPTARESH